MKSLDEMTGRELWDHLDSVIKPSGRNYELQPRTWREMWDEFGGWASFIPMAVFISSPIWGLMLLSWLLEGR